MVHRKRDLAKDAARVRATTRSSGKARTTSSSTSRAPLKRRRISGKVLARGARTLPAQASATARNRAFGQQAARVRSTTKSSGRARPKRTFSSLLNKAVGRAGTPSSNAARVRARTRSSGRARSTRPSARGGSADQILRNRRSKRPLSFKSLLGSVRK